MSKIGKFYESEYEKAVVELLRAEGWIYTHGDEVPNRRVDEALIEDDLRAFMKPSIILSLFIATALTLSIPTVAVPISTKTFLTSILQRIISIA